MKEFILTTESLKEQGACDNWYYFFIAMFPSGSVNILDKEEQNKLISFIKKSNDKIAFSELIFDINQDKEYFFYLCLYNALLYLNKNHLMQEFYEWWRTGNTKYNVLLDKFNDLLLSDNIIIETGIKQFI